jgi:hypothetical protein
VRAFPRGRALFAISFLLFSSLNHRSGKPSSFLLAADVRVPFSLPQLVLTSDGAASAKCPSRKWLPLRVLVFVAETLRRNRSTAASFLLRPLSYSFPSTLHPRKCLQPSPLLPPGRRRRHHRLRRPQGHKPAPPSRRMTKTRPRI